MAMLSGLIKKMGGEDDEEPRPYGMPGTPQNPNTGIGGGLAPFSAPPMGGGKDRGYEMPGTGSSGGVEDAARMLGEATARNNSLSDLGNRRAKLDIFDRPGHEALDREESQIFGGMPRSSYVDGGASSPFAAPPPGAGGPLQDGPAKSPFKFSQQSVSEILSRYPPTPAGLEQAFKENPQLSESGSRISTLKSGKIFDPTTGRDVDVGLAFGSGGGKGWAWQTGEGGGAGAGAGARSMFNNSSIAPLLQGNAQGNIQQALSQIGGASDDGLLQRLIAQLQQGEQA